MNRMLYAVLVVVLIGVSPVVAAEREALRTISVSGAAIAEIPPDMIVWRVVLKSFNKDVRKAKEENDK